MSENTKGIFEQLGCISGSDLTPNNFPKLVFGFAYTLKQCPPILENFVMFLVEFVKVTLEVKCILDNHDRPPFWISSWSSGKCFENIIIATDNSSNNPIYW